MHFSQHGVIVKTIVFGLFVLSMLTSQLAMTAECLQEGENVTFTGKISRETFPGRPNYESIDNGDEPETYWILTTDNPNCVEAKSPEDGSLYEVAKSTTRFQLAFEDPTTYKTHKKLVEQRATVTGQLYAGSTGHHHTKALIFVKRIKPTKK